VCPAAAPSCNNIGCSADWKCPPTHGRSKEDILSQIRDLQSEMSQLENGRSGSAEASNKSN
jgi:hypothetical protein